MTARPAPNAPVHAVRNLRIIKAAQATQVFEALGIVEQAKADAATILAAARDDAAQLIEDAKQDAVRLKADAMAHAAADSDAWRAQQRARAASEAAASMASEIAAVRTQLAAFDAPLIALVENALSLVIGELDRGDRIARLVRHGIADLKQQLGLVLRVAPADEAIARAALAALRAQDATCPIERIEIAAALGPDEFHLVAAGTVLDLSVAGQLERLTAAMRSAAERAPS